MTAKFVCHEWSQWYWPYITNKLTCSSLSCLLIPTGCLFFLLSPDGGHSFHWLTNFPGNSSIMVFTSSPFDGKFAFLTDDQQVFLCL